MAAWHRSFLTRATKVRLRTSVLVRKTWHTPAELLLPVAGPFRTAPSHHQTAARGFPQAADFSHLPFGVFPRPGPDGLGVVLG